MGEAVRRYSGTGLGPPAAFLLMELTYLISHVFIQFSRREASVPGVPLATRLLLTRVCMCTSFHSRSRINLRAACFASSSSRTAEPWKWVSAHDEVQSSSPITWKLSDSSM